MIRREYKQQRGCRNRHPSAMHASPADHSLIYVKRYLFGQICQHFTRQPLAGCYLEMLYLSLSVLSPPLLWFKLSSLLGYDFSINNGAFAFSERKRRVQNEKECFRIKRMENLPLINQKVCLTKVYTNNRTIDFFEHVCYND